MSTLTETEPPKTKIKDLLTIHQLCGIFNKERKAIDKLGIPRVVLGPGDYRYNPADVEAFIEERTERP